MLHNNDCGLLLHSPLVVGFLHTLHKYAGKKLLPWGKNNRRLQAVPDFQNTLKYALFSLTNATFFLSHACTAAGAGRGGGLLVVHYPGVLGHVGELHARSLLLHQQAGNQIARARGHKGREAQVDVADAAIRGAVSLGLEGRTAHQELVGEHAERPHVSGVVVLAGLHHFRRQVVQSTAESGAARGGGVHGPAKVRNLNVALKNTWKRI